MKEVDSCEAYLRYLRRFFGEKELEECLKFYLRKEVGKRKDFSKLIELMGDVEDCGENEYEDIFLSYTRVVMSEFGKKLLERDFSDLRVIDNYFLRYFEIWPSKMEEIFLKEEPWKSVEK